MSKLSYCDVVYGPALRKSDEKRLQRVQNACLRYSFGIRKFDHISHIFVEHGILNLPIARALHLLTFTHKIVQHRMPPYLAEKLVRFENVNAISTGNKQRFVIPRHTSAVFKLSFSYAASKLFNTLPPKFLNYNLLNFKIKKKLKLLLLRN
nr:unnamed protein product [Callosobruchus analis]